MVTIKPIDKIRILFGVIACAILVLLITALLFFEIPEANNNAANILIGSVSTIFGMVYQYFFGSSEGSSRKNDILHNAISNDTTIE